MCMYVYLYIYIYIYVCVCVCTVIHACIYVCVCVCVSILNPIKSLVLNAVCCFDLFSTPCIVAEMSMLPVAVLGSPSARSNPTVAIETHPKVL